LNGAASGRGVYHPPSSDSSPSCLRFARSTPFPVARTQGPSPPWPRRCRAR
jgi:hypothetical protein